MQYQEILDAVHATVSPLIGCGRVADYIPELAAVDPRRFGLALATTDGAVYGVGDWQTPLSIQSVSKVFSLAVALSGNNEAIWRRVGREPSGVGLPAKSGVGGGILAVVPNRCTLAVWAPGLDESGNSCAGRAALDAFTTLTGWSVF